MSELMPDPVAMKHYKNKQWGFSLDIPKRWNAFPAMLSNSPYEVIRFASHEAGYHILIVFRVPCDPEETPQSHAKRTQASLETQAFSNFVYGTATIASRPVVTLDSEQPNGDRSMSCRHYFLIDGSAIAYALAFGSTGWGAMNGLFERMAQSFTAG